MTGARSVMVTGRSAIFSARHSAKAAPETNDRAVNPRAAWRIIARAYNEAARAIQRLREPPRPQVGSWADPLSRRFELWSKARYANVPGLFGRRSDVKCRGCRGEGKIMGVDWKLTSAVVAVIAFNLPIVFVAWKLRNVTGLGDVLSEKDSTGVSTNSLSYSRVTGMVGAVVVGSLFWIVSNIVVATAILDPRAVSTILAHISPIFLVGAALFLPYAFNQLKTLTQ
jgi:hypothetical protein